MEEPAPPVRRPVLADHKRVGKKFVPPFPATLGAIDEVSWIDDILPELLWLGVVNDAFGLRRSADLAVSFAREVHVIIGGYPMLGLTSTYAEVTAEQWTRIVDTLDAATAENMRAALRPLVALYPRCPFGGLWGDTQPAARDGDVQRVAQAVGNVTHRGERPATLMQANAIYLALVTGSLNVFKGSMLSRLDDLIDYPQTPESRAVAAAVRAMINGLGGQSRGRSSEWPEYFWKRGMELSPCALDSQ